MTSTTTPTAWPDWLSPRMTRLLSLVSPAATRPRAGSEVVCVCGAADPEVVCRAVCVCVCVCVCVWNSPGLTAAQSAAIREGQDAWVRDYVAAA
jgi:hypothetical protein